MNVLGFVFCILAVLSFGAILAFENQVGAYRLRASYLGHIRANRDILNQTTSEFYDSLKVPPSSTEKEKEEQKNKIQAEKSDSRPLSPGVLATSSPKQCGSGLGAEFGTQSLKAEEDELPPPSSINPFCARLNLSPLIEQEAIKEPYLYETTAKLLRTFYGKALFNKKVRTEYKFLDAFLKEVRHQVINGEFSVLEKVSFKDPQFQLLYYRMLKGTKKSNVLEGIGYPSLLDYIKIEPAQSKICLFHSHLNLLTIFFTPKGATKLYSALHMPKASAVTEETIERICQEVHAPLLDPEVFNLFEIHPKQHQPNSNGTLIGEDPETHLSLRKVVTFHKPK